MNLKLIPLMSQIKYSLPEKLEKIMMSNELSKDERKTKISKILIDLIKQFENCSALSFKEAFFLPNVDRIEKIISLWLAGFVLGFFENSHVSLLNEVFVDKELRKFVEELIDDWKTYKDFCNGTSASNFVDNGRDAVIMISKSIVIYKMIYLSGTYMLIKTWVNKDNENLNKEQLRSIFDVWKRIYNSNDEGYCLNAEMSSYFMKKACNYLDFEIEPKDLKCVEFSGEGCFVATINEEPLKCSSDFEEDNENGSLIDSVNKLNARFLDEITDFCRMAKKRDLQFEQLLEIRKNFLLNELDNCEKLLIDQFDSKFLKCDEGQSDFFARFCEMFAKNSTEDDRSKTVFLALARDYCETCGYIPLLSNLKILQNNSNEFLKSLMLYLNIGLYSYSHNECFDNGSTKVVINENPAIKATIDFETNKLDILLLAKMVNEVENAQEMFEQMFYKILESLNLLRFQRFIESIALAGCDFSLYNKLLELYLKLTTFLGKEKIENITTNTDILALIRKACLIHCFNDGKTSNQKTKQRIMSNKYKINDKDIYLKKLIIELMKGKIEDEDFDLLNYIKSIPILIFDFDIFHENQLKYLSIRNLFQYIAISLIGYKRKYNIQSEHIDKGCVKYLL